MAMSQIKITFNEDLVVDSTLTFDLNHYVFVGLHIPHNETWKTIRSASHQVTTGVPTLIAGERSAINFASAYNLDYGTSGFIVTRTGNEVTIVCPNELAYFSGGLAMYDGDTVADVLFDITNSDASVFEISELVYEEAAAPCTHVQVSVETSDLATKILSPVSVDPNTDNPFSFEVLRGQYYTLKIENSDGTQITQNFQAPKALNASNFTLNIIKNPSGATVNISNTNSEGLELEYSLDGTTWQTSPIFSGLAPDTYTLYVRDQLGCSFEKAFEIDEFINSGPYFYISKANSIRFANRITWGDSANYKTDENTLSCEAFAKDQSLAYQETQLFQSGDIITTQFKSNYKDIVVSVVKEDLTEVLVPVIKKTNNIGIKDKRDAIKYNLGGGKVGIYFTSGNTYDYDTNVINGTFSLNGSLPYWATFGNYIVISGIWFLIEDVIFDESKNAEILVISDVYSGPDSPIVVGSIFNYFNYEVYEFTIDMVAYLNETFRVRINNNSTIYDDLIHLSEKINVKVVQNGTVEIRYKNEDNTDIFYATGIEHKIRQPITSIGISDDEDSETHKTDTNTILLDGNIWEGEEFTFRPVTKEIARKIKIALLHKVVFINEVGYVKKGEIEVEGPLEDSNLHIVKAKMYKNGNVYNASGTGNELFNGESIEIPGLIEHTSGLLRY